MDKGEELYEEWRDEYLNALQKSGAKSVIGSAPYWEDLLPEQQEAWRGLANR